jgi:NAD(P)-dependent dehydrogenase (short-subunit alcohol dehydrogenase family)
MMQAAMPQEARASYLARAPMGRVGKPEEVVALVGLLASERCGFGTGQVVYIAGGLSLGAQHDVAF